ncbi:hypothetical protein [Rubrolithibacter danxiaensis]|uniref:hypothetical protein n=1 Tax=Rubrolithibacter danxiaensis TaxID=3390805 RepID=UPI003BF91968
METILSETEAENALTHLSEKEQNEVKRDKIRFGEFYIKNVDDTYSRVNPLDVVVQDGIPVMIQHTSLTLI